MVMPSLLQLENPACLSRLILAASDSQVRYQGASGGVVSEIIRYLFAAGKVQTAVSFTFDREAFFVPRLIYSYEDYCQVGSIYHEVPIADFLRQNKAAIKGAIVVVCLPCQVSAVLHLLDKYRICHYVISLFCSGQQKKEATQRYLKDVGIEQDAIERFTYRGNGWPSGIRIMTSTGTEFFDPNTGGRWGKYRLPPFGLGRCMFCKDTFGVRADITAGDPWLKRYMETETNGISMVGTLTVAGDSIIKSMIQDGILEKIEEVSEEEFVNSQRSAIVGKFVKRNTIAWQRLFYRISATRFYDKFIMKSDMKLHARFYGWYKRVVFTFLRLKLMFSGSAK